MGAYEDDVGWFISCDYPGCNVEFGDDNDPYPYEDTVVEDALENGWAEIDKEEATYYFCPKHAVIKRRWPAANKEKK